VKSLSIQFESGLFVGVLCWGFFKRKITSAITDQNEFKAQKANVISTKAEQGY